MKAQNTTSVYQNKINDIAKESFIKLYMFLIVSPYLIKES